VKGACHSCHSPRDLIASGRKMGVGKSTHKLCGDENNASVNIAHTPRKLFKTAWQLILLDLRCWGKRKIKGGTEKEASRGKVNKLRLKFKLLGWAKIYRAPAFHTPQKYEMATIWVRATHWIIEWIGQLTRKMTLASVCEWAIWGVMKRLPDVVTVSI